MSAGTAAVIPMAYPVKPSRSARVSSPWPTCTMRSRQTGHTAEPYRSPKSVRSFLPRPGPRWTPASWKPLSSSAPSMWALEQPLTSVPRHGDVVPVGAVVVLGGTLGAIVLLAGTGQIAEADLRALLNVMLHGTLLTTAVGAAASGGGDRWSVAGPAAFVFALIAIGACAARFDPRGTTLYLMVLLWLGWLGARGRLVSIGVRATSTGALIVAALIGLSLGGHVLLSAAFTLGYRIRSDGLAAWGLALAYDAGLSVASSELFFRGVLFNRVQREVSFAAGAAVATIAYLARFLPDPRLPLTLEVLAGAGLYLTLLSVANSWLFWWSGSLLPALVSALTFFSLYRLLAI